MSDAFAGGGKGSGKNSVDVANGNSFDDENGDIQVWLLSEEDKVPETKADADALVSVVVTAGPFSRVGFLDQEDGTYILVAANKTAYESLDDGDTITAGQEYSAIEVVLAGGENKKFTVSNDPKGGPPLITEGILPPPGGPGGPGSDG
ncbi:MAG: hypothetical protein AAF483_14220 [Planctomycetota bacterium]